MKKSYLNLTGKFHGISQKTKTGSKGEYKAHYLNLICHNSDDEIMVIRVRTSKPELFDKAEPRETVCRQFAKDHSLRVNLTMVPRLCSGST